MQLRLHVNATQGTGSRVEVAKAGVGVVGSGLGPHLRRDTYVIARCCFAPDVTLPACVGAVSSVSGAHPILGLSIVRSSLRPDPWGHTHVITGHGLTPDIPLATRVRPVRLRFGAHHRSQQYGKRPDREGDGCLGGACTANTRRFGMVLPPSRASLGSAQCKHYELPTGNGAVEPIVITPVAGAVTAPRSRCCRPRASRPRSAGPRARSTRCAPASGLRGPPGWR
jgi:hypothetical protein